MTQSSPRGYDGQGDPFAGLPKQHFGAILADPPWTFQTWSQEGKDRSPERHYSVMSSADIAALPVSNVARKDAVLFMWICWPQLIEAIGIIEQWGFSYKTCAFAWLKADASQIDLWRDDLDAQVGMGYYTRSNSEVCLLATRGKPKRLNADVRQGIIAPRREHSRKPDEVHGRIERLVAGPYLDLFARESTRPGWSFWGNEVTKFNRANNDQANLAL